METMDGFPGDGVDREWLTLVPLLAELMELEWLAEALEFGLESERVFCFDSAKELTLASYREFPCEIEFPWETDLEFPLTTLRGLFVRGSFSSIASCRHG